MHPLHSCTVKLPHLYVVRIACCELQVGKFPCDYHQWFRDHIRVILHLHIYLVCSNKRKGKLLNPVLLRLLSILFMHGKFMAKRNELTIYVTLMKLRLKLVL